MLFNTPQFFVFMVVVFIAAHFLRSPRQATYFYLLCSYFFYMMWNPVFVLLLVFSSIANHFFARWIHFSPQDKRAKLVLAIAFNLLLLGFFKYFAFFQSSLHWLSSGHWATSEFSTHIVLPVAISFYTFHALSYLIDCYRGILVPATLAEFSLYIAFFPHLVAGPIVRAAHLIPQIQTPRQPKITPAILLLILRGLVKKAIFADNMAPFTSAVFASPANFPSLIIWLAALAFTIQIYCDFSGYTDIAIGIARALGFEFPQNFDRPYFSRTPTEFWRRWHMSLSTWLRDYLYLPLGGNRLGAARTYLNLMITMVLGGLWHGASWNFVLWGAFHGALLGIYRWLDIDAKLRGAGKFANFLSWAITLFWIQISWLIFAITDIPRLNVALHKFIFFDFNFNIAGIGLGPLSFFSTLLLMVVFSALHIWSYYKPSGIDGALAAQSHRVWFPFALFLVVIVYYFLLPSNELPFIYFQF